MASSNVAPRKLLFAGPTLADLPDGSAAPEAGFEVSPPAGRADVAAVIGGDPGLLVIVDGRFHQTLSVGHAELRHALEAGWTVWGLSSMGAIRAYEMRDLGMKGFGRVYEHFLVDEDFQDDEVALLHSGQAPFPAISEPLVHLRHFVADLTAAGVLTAETAHEVIAELKRLWYGERTARRLVAIVAERAGEGAAAEVKARLPRLERFRVKTTDLDTFLRTRVWESNDYRPHPVPAPYTASATREAAVEGAGGAGGRPR
jgi:hypothetical protein